MSAPPSASDWASPPEFYLDENVVSRSVRRRLTGLGYAVHTPPELYGSREASSGTRDEDWLARVSPHGWTVIGRDAKIMERPSELAAYRDARLHMFLLPGQATTARLVQLVETNLPGMCTFAAARKPDVWRLTDTGPELVPRRTPERARGG